MDFCIFALGMDVRDGNLFLQLLPLLSLFLGCCLYGLCCNHNGDEGVEETKIERIVQEDNEMSTI